MQTVNYISLYLLLILGCSLFELNAARKLESQRNARRNARPQLQMGKRMRSSPEDMLNIEVPEGLEWMSNPIQNAPKAAARERTAVYSRWADASDENEIISGAGELNRAQAHDDTEETESAEYESEVKWQSMERIEEAELIQREPAENLQRRYLRKSCLRSSSSFAEHRTYPRSYEHPGFEAALPREWDWRNVSGVNYCSPNRNQHIPVYCGGCWVFGSLGALNDRFNVARKNRWPMTNLSPQEIIDCNGKGNCQGGEVFDVYNHAKTHGLVEEGCNNYKAVNGKCTPFTRCGSCWPDNCFAIQNYTRYYVKDFGKLSGREKMMAEIHNRGPIACTIGATVPFELNYTRGIYLEYSDIPSNHIVSVSGWGVDRETNTEFWIVRNSWGDAWGELGWFRIVTSLYKNGQGDMYNMGIERECYFVDPDVSNLD